MAIQIAAARLARRTFALRAAGKPLLERGIEAACREQQRNDSNDKSTHHQPPQNRPLAENVTAEGVMTGATVTSLLLVAVAPARWPR
jgi:hypothetical protein